MAWKDQRVPFQCSASVTALSVLLVLYPTVVQAVAEAQDTRMSAPAALLSGELAGLPRRGETPTGIRIP